MRQQLGKWQINHCSEKGAGEAVLCGDLGDGGTPMT